ncbi:MAG TPA: methyl-accepting chemotaxis protein [Spirochaetota bacterium]|nr:methyl-accepting chemotaxis protein [Spirochaetota bacterium]
MKRFRVKSLKSIISLFVVVIIIILTVILVTTSYNTAYNAVERAFVNQVNNFNNEIDRNMKDFYKTEMANAVFLSKIPQIVNACQTGQFEGVRSILSAFFNEKGIYEQVFVSSPELKSVIYVSANGKADGVRWGEIPEYRKNAEEALKGNTYFSDIGKSPVTGLTVIVVTAPVMAGKKVIGIVGLPVDVGTFSVKLVKDVTIGKTGYPFLTNLDGITFAHPDEKNIFNLNINDYDWGKKMLTMPSGSLIFYKWENKDKLLSFVRNDTNRYIIGTTMYLSDINSEARLMALLMVIVAVSCIFISALGIFFFISRRLKPLDLCKDVMSSMAEGDLSRRYTGRNNGDEIGEIADAMNRSLNSFEGIITEIINSAQNLAQAVEQISTGNQNLSQRTSEQASALEEMAASIEQATATIQQNAENAGTAKDLTDQGVTKSAEGNTIATEAVTAISEMNESSKKVAEITGVINSIAFQTNLLALNAAVEAARAGEQGRGFAVVAGEVRNLAQRAGSAAKEIENLINETITKVEKGTDLVNMAGTALSEITDAAKISAKIITEIAAASQEQKTGIEQINQAVVDLDMMTQQNAALVEETASASEEMAGQAQELTSMMKRFTVSDES